MDALILTSRYGKKRCVLAKVISAFCFSITMEAVILLVGFLLFAAGRGLEWMEYRYPAERAYGIFEDCAAAQML